MTQEQWMLDPDPGAVVDELTREFDVSRVFATLLAQRVDPPTIDNVRSFLNPVVSHLHSPWLMTGMTVATDRLKRAIDAKEKIVVYGDYDTDGVTACALLFRIFRALGHTVECRLPSRREEGYGISDAFVRKAIADKVGVVVTVDCGTSEHERIRTLAEGGVDVIVTDHHEPGDRDFPQEALAVLNPKRSGDSYPFRDLTGVGVAFKLAWALCEKMVGSPKVGPRLREALLSLLSVAALGTIADVAPLVEENRVIVANGLRTMHRAGPGIAALLDICRLTDGELTARSVAFAVSPRLNAAGRLGEAELALRLLIEDEPGVAAQLALELDQKNTERQALCQLMLDEALALVHSTHDLEKDAALLVEKEGWHEGVTGIVAGRLAEMFGKPTAVVAFPPGEVKGRGSARGIQGLNLYQALANAREHMLTFGGHEQAAGFSIQRSEVDALRRRFKSECREQIDRRGLTPILSIDMELSLSEVNNLLVAELDRLRPFGHGNPEPKFLARNVRASGPVRPMGAQMRHFSFNVSQGGVSYRAVVFNNPELMPKIENSRNEWDMVIFPSLNRYYSPPRLEFKVEDIRPAS